MRGKITILLVLAVLVGLVITGCAKTETKTKTPEKTESKTETVDTDQFITKDDPNNMKFDGILKNAQYAKEGPVKKDYIKSEKFNVVTVSFEKGVEIAPHPEPYAVFFYVLEGKGNFTTGRGTFQLSKDMGLFLAKDEIRGIKCLEKMTIMGVQDGH